MQLLLEHEMVPGTVYENRLILGGGCCAVFNEMDLHESAGSNGTVKFRGKFQEADAINKNKRTYPFGVLAENVKSLKEAIDNGGLIGELDHPTDSIVHFANASHKISRLWWEGKVLMGEGVILNTPHGKILKALINDGVRVGISSRGVGNGRVNEEGILVIGESYKLITFDAVADPSTSQAFQEKVVAKESYKIPQGIHSSVKNEASGIHTLNKDLILAALGGIFQKQINEIKRG
jgi:Prohead core protein serine protease